MIRGAPHIKIRAGSGGRISLGDAGRRCQLLLPPVGDQGERRPAAQKAMLAVLNAQFVSYFLSIAALVVFYKHMWVLVGTAIGLMVMLEFTIIMEYVKGRKLPVRMTEETERR